MEIQFVNMPSDRTFDSELLLGFKTMVEGIVGKSVKVTDIPITAKQIKVHVSVIDCECLTSLDRRRIARSVLWLLHNHAVDEGADVHFMTFHEEGYFTTEDFPEIISRPHPSLL